MHRRPLLAMMLLALPCGCGRNDDGTAPPPVVDPCAAVVCQQAPAAECIDAATLRNYDATGLCDGGECVYNSADSTCALGCDATLGQCESGCPVGEHLCGGGCSSNTSLDSCGARCSACPSDANGAAWCDGNSCGIACNGDALWCGGSCAQCPAGVGIDSVECLASKCAATCAVGFHACASGCCANWVIMPVAGDAAMDAGGNLGFAIDAADRLQISYYSGNPYEAHYQQWVATSPTGWSRSSSVLGAAPWGRGWGLSLALHPQFGAAVSYHDGSDQSVHLAYATGASSTVPTSGTNRDSALAFDAAGNPHLALRNESNGNSLQHATLGPQGWVFEEVVASGIAANPAMALDAAGVPHFAFGTRVTTPAIHYELSFVRWTGAGSVVETVHPLQSRNASAVRLDATGTAHIVFAAWEGSGVRLMYGKQGSSGWDVQVVDPTATAGDAVALALDRFGQPHISYYDESGQDLKYARWSGAAWSIEVVDALDVAGNLSAIALDSQESPYILYQSIRADGSSVVSLAR